MNNIPVAHALVEPPRRPPRPRGPHRGLAGGLLAPKVLAGGTTGYRHHPQLDRFRQTPNPDAAIAAWLAAVADEAHLRGYRFDATKIASTPAPDASVPGHHGATLLRTRPPAGQGGASRRGLVAGLTQPRAHPLFRVVDGDVEPWERARAADSPTSRSTS